MLTIETGMGTGEICSIWFQMPRPFTYEEFADVVSRMGLLIEVRDRRLQHHSDGAPVFVRTFEIIRPLQKVKIPRRFLWWKWTEVREEFIPHRTLDCRVVGKFGDGPQKSIEVGCAYNFWTDSMVTSVGYSSDPVRIKDFLSDLYAQLAKE